MSIIRTFTGSTNTIIGGVRVILDPPEESGSVLRQIFQIVVVHIRTELLPPVFSSAWLDSGLQTIQFQALETPAPMFYNIDVYLVILSAWFYCPKYTVTVGTF